MVWARMAGAGYLGEDKLVSALVLEMVPPFLFLVVIHVAGIQVTGVWVKPARSFGPAVIIGGVAISQLWLFLIAPLIGAALAGILFRQKLLETE